MFENKKILVTGGRGFSGSNLVKSLNQLEPKLILNPSSQDYDLRFKENCAKITQDVDIVFHLAALIGIPYSYVSPLAYIRTNIEGTFNVLESAKNEGIEQTLITSTSETYGSAQYVPIDEEHPLQPQSPYSASKIAADAMAMSFYNSFDLPVTIARPFNTYGPRQSARAVIPTIITQIANGVKEIKLGDLTPTRDFNYVEDTCKGLIAIALTFSPAIIGSGKPSSHSHSISSVAIFTFFVSYSKSEGNLSEI